MAGKVSRAPSEHLPHYKIMQYFGSMRFASTLVVFEYLTVCHHVADGSCKLTWREDRRSKGSPFSLRISTMFFHLLRTSQLAMPLGPSRKLSMGNTCTEQSVCSSLRSRACSEVDAETRI